MGFRLQKRIRIFKGLTLNLSKSGTSWTVGGPGASVSFRTEKGQRHGRCSGDGAAVEARETVYDPLGAAPAVPFGFLNRQWQALLAQATTADAVWSFRAVRDGDWGLLDERTGYALVRRGKVVAFMVASIEHRERPSSTDSRLADLATR